MAANPYDPVTTYDTTQLTDDEWGLNLPPISYKSYSSSRLKSLCFEARQRPKCVVIVLAAIVVIVLLSIIIAVAANKDSGRHPTGSEPKWQSTDQGLEWYPVPQDKTIVITFNPQAFDKLQLDPNVKQLQEKLKSYNTLAQVGEDFVHCNGTYHPYNKTCKILKAVFGESCVSSRNYGYGNAQPCIFMELNLPENRSIAPITKDSPLWNEAQSAMADHNDPYNVPVSCKGTTKEDDKILNKVEGLGDNGERIAIFPPTGLPAYIYRPRDTSMVFLKPAVMIEMTSLLDNHKVHITCTAWGQLHDDDDKLVEHDLLSTQFAVYVNRH